MPAVAPRVTIAAVSDTPETTGSILFTAAIAGGTYRGDPVLTWSIAPNEGRLIPFRGTSALWAIPNLQANTEYTIRLDVLVTDADGTQATGTGTDTFTVTAVRNPPRPVIRTAPQTITAGQTIQLDASDSDPGGVVTGRAWDVVPVADQPQGWVWADSNGRRPRWTAPRNGPGGRPVPFALRYTITDDDGETASATVTISVQFGVDGRERISIAEQVDITRPRIYGHAEDRIRIGERLDIGRDRSLELAERITIAEAPAIAAPLFVELVERITVGEAPGVVPPLSIEGRERIRIGEFPRIVPGVHAGELIRIGERVDFAAWRELSLHEGIAIAAAPNITPPLSADRRERITIAESDQFNSGRQLEFIEAIRISDAITDRDRMRRLTLAEAIAIADRWSYGFAGIPFNQLRVELGEEGGGFADVRVQIDDDGNLIIEREGRTVLTVYLDGWR